MITKLTRKTATQVCAVCGRTNQIKVSGLQAGRNERADPGVIDLPKCPDCGGVECLFRNHDATKPFGLLVNRLHARLKAAGQVFDGFPSSDKDAPSENMAPDHDTITLGG